MNNNNLSFLDLINIFSVMLQVHGYELDIKQASNDDILKELQKQDKSYLEKILENQNKIIKLLEGTND